MNNIKIIILFLMATLIIFIVFLLKTGNVRNEVGLANDNEGPTVEVSDFIQNKTEESIDEGKKVENETTAPIEAKAESLKATYSDPVIVEDLPAVQEVLELGIFISGRTQSLLTDPLAKRVGVDEEGELLEEIEGVFSEISSNHSEFTIKNAYTGRYSLFIRAGYKEDISISASVTNGSTGDFKEIKFLHDTEESILLDIVIKKVDGLYVVQLIPEVQFEPKTELVYEGNETGTLIWNNDPEGKVNTFHVYARSLWETNFTFLAKTNSNKYQTSHKLVNFGGEEWYYRVFAVNEEGVRGPNGNIVSNSLYVIPVYESDVTEGKAPLKVNFKGHSNFTPTKWEWDFDKDGIVDSNEKNPTYVFKKPGIYYPSLKVYTPLGDEKTISTIRIVVF